jgi:integrase
MKTIVGHFTREQLLAILAAARAESERDWLMILVAYQHAMRASEVTDLRTTDVDALAGYLCVRRLKSSNTTVQPMVEDDEPLLSEREALTAWVRTRPVGARVFGITSRQHLLSLFKKHGRAAGVPQHTLRMHNCKHTGLKHLLDAGVQLNELQAHSGHVSLSSLGRYLVPSAAQVESSVAAARKRMAIPMPMDSPMLVSMLSGVRSCS